MIVFCFNLLSTPPVERLGQGSGILGYHPCVLQNDILITDALDSWFYMGTGPTNLTTKL